MPPMDEYPTFYHLPRFDANWTALGLGDEELADLQQQLIDNPLAGAVMAGTGGLRKLRFPLPGRGKSGSVRVLYAHFGERFVLLLAGVYGKSQLSNVTAGQKREFARILRTFEDALPPADTPPAD